MHVCRIENDNVCFQVERRQRPGVIGYPYCLDRNVGIARHLGVDRHEIVFAFQLNAVAAQIDERDSTRS